MSQSNDRKCEQSNQDSGVIQHAASPKSDVFSVFLSFFSAFCGVHPNRLLRRSFPLNSQHVFENALFGYLGIPPTEFHSARCDMEIMADETYWRVTILEKSGEHVDLEFIDYEGFAEKSFVLNERFVRALKDRVNNSEHYESVVGIVRVVDPDGNKVRGRDLRVLLGVTPAKAMVSVLIGVLRDGGFTLLGFHPYVLIRGESDSARFIRSVCVSFVERPEDYSAVSVLSSL